MIEIDVLLLAAGLGTRMRPLTAEIPKALLPIYGTPILDLHLRNLFAGDGAAQVRRVVINTHHLAEQIAAHIDRHPERERIVISHEPEILGTGGAIAKAALHLESDPVVIVNSDALMALPIAEVVGTHRHGGFLATLVLTESAVNPNVAVEGNRVSAILAQPEPGRALTFTGLHAVSPALVTRLPRGRFHGITDTYKELIREGALGAWVWSPRGDLPFLDIGTPAAYLEAHRILRDRRPPATGGHEVEEFGWCDPSCTIGAGARIRRSIVMAGTRIGPGVTVLDSIVGPEMTVTADLHHVLLTRAGSAPIPGRIGPGGSPDA